MAEQLMSFIIVSYGKMAASLFNVRLFHFNTLVQIKSYNVLGISYERKMCFNLLCNVLKIYHD